MLRYSRQVLLPQVGPGGQARLRAARVLLVGCGALGTHIAEQLVRAGVGFLRIVDRDIVELSNLQRQTLFDETHATAGTPKALAAVERLSAVNSEVQLEPQVMDVGSDNIISLADDVQLVVDGTDNVPTRFLVNDVAVKHEKPWIYGACVGTEGRAMPVLPGGPCLRCVFPDPPSPGELPTCDTQGVLASSAAIVASWQVVAALRVLVGDPPPVTLLSVDAWTQRVKLLDLIDARRADCVCCGRREFEFLAHPPQSGVSLCGRDAVQVRPTRASFDLSQVARRLSAVARVVATEHIVRAELVDPRVRLTIFQDGRAIIAGTTDPGRAQAIYDRFVGR